MDDQEVREFKPLRYCMIVTCIQKHHAHDLCKKHYMRKKRKALRNTKANKEVKQIKEDLS